MITAATKHKEARIACMDFKGLLIRQNFDPEKVMVMRHSPTEPKLRKILPWFTSLIRTVRYTD
jgi:hypothetical protein